MGNWTGCSTGIEKLGQLGSYRIIGDFGPLNDRIIKDCYDICTPDQIWRKVDPVSNIFFACDATSSYNQIANTANTETLMAIALPTAEGTKYYHFKTAGMGCSNLRPAWCRASDAVSEMSLRSSNVWIIASFRLRAKRHSFPN